ncbi:hypothetical protein K3495_g10597 [Podosphaera aphanis]|nr:hypothetical protein K3495_g10597 [Podosphaera aphanis]
MKGHFDNKNLWTKYGGKTIIHAVQNDELYVLEHITKDLQGMPLDSRIGKLNAWTALESRDKVELLSPRNPKTTGYTCQDETISDLDLSEKDIDQSDDDDPAEIKKRELVTGLSIGDWGTTVQA